MLKGRYRLAAAVLVAGATGGATWLSLAARPAHGGPIGPPPASPATKQMLNEIDAKRIKQAIGTLVAFGTRHTGSSQVDPDRGIGAATSWAFDQLQQIAATSGGAMTVQQQTFIQPVSSRIPVPTSITNVIATLQGTQSPSRVYVVGAHIDSRVTDVLNFVDDAPGADDDASGVAAVLELARVMATRHFDATIEFVLFGGEEQGLYGSAYLAAQAKAAGTDIEGMLSDDIIGSSLGQNTVHDRNDVRLFAESPPTSESPQQTAVRQAFGGENDSSSRELARFIRDAAGATFASPKVWIIYRRDRILRSGDHVSFLQQGYPAVRWTEPNEDYRHEHQDVRVDAGVQYGDLEQFLDYNYIAGVARVNGAALVALADGPAAPHGVQLVTSTLSPDTHLQWQANTDPDLAGYQIVYRDTMASQWDHVINVGNVTSYTLTGMTSDNYLFGVRAIDTDGNRSVVTFTVPA